MSVQTLARETARQNWEPTGKVRCKHRYRFCPNPSLPHPTSPRNPRHCLTIRVATGASAHLLSDQDARQAFEDLPRLARLAMKPKGRVKVGIIGSRFEADIHAESFRLMPDEAEVVAVASPTPGNAEQFARKHGLSRYFTDYRQMLAEPDIEMVTIAAPNALHAAMTLDAANAGKHVVCEKPLCMTLEEADLMIDTCRQRGVLLLYAEELFFTPKYVKAKQMADEGAFGKVYLVKQTEKHFGPHAPWFWDV
jgi:hypothetical protein